MKIERSKEKMSNSKLISLTIDSPNCNKPRNHAIDTITIHHMACNLTVEQCGAGFANPSRQASSNYGIGTDGRIGLYVDEANRSWCSSSPLNDHRAITIEVANDKPSDAGGWHVSDKALASLINLCVDICKRNGKSKMIWCGSLSATNARNFAANEMRMTLHKWFAATGCPGPYLESKMSYIAAEVTKRLSGDSSGGGTAAGTIYRVQVGAYKSKGNAEVMLASLKNKGFSGFIVTAGDIYRVQVGAYQSKANAENMLKSLKAKGFDGFVTTANAPAPAPKKTVDELAREVIRGDWGVDPERSRRLTAAGYDAKAVQARVNQLI
jgi:hypothetical protein